MHIVFSVAIIEALSHCNMAKEIRFDSPTSFIFPQPFFTELIQFHFIFNCKLLLCFISVVLSMERFFRFFHTEESKLLPHVSHEHRSYLHPSSGKEGAHHFGRPIACHPMSSSQCSRTLIVEHSSLYNKEALLLINHYHGTLGFNHMPCNHLFLLS